MSDEQDIAAALQAAEAAENRRREASSRTPGLGVLMPLDQPPNGPSVGKYGLPGLDITGEGYDVLAPDDAQQMKAYGMVRPHYADALVAGLAYRPAANIPVRRSFIWQRHRGEPAGRAAPLAAGQGDGVAAAPLRTSPRMPSKSRSRCLLSRRGSRIQRT
jgi:hypothetical protein